MTVLLHASVKREVTRLEHLIASADPEDAELLRCAAADLILCAAKIRRRLDDMWSVEQPSRKRRA